MSSHDFFAFAEKLAVERIAMKAATVLPLLLLQKPRGTFRPKDFAVILDRRLAQWKRGEIDALVREGRVLQNELRNTSRRKSDMRHARGTCSSNFQSVDVAGESQSRTAMDHGFLVQF